MSYQLNSNLTNLVPYEPTEGEYAIRLDANESFLHLPINIVEKAIQIAMERGENRYPDSKATRLCQAFANFYDIDSANVTAGNGSDELIALITASFFGSDDLVVTLENDFSMYKVYCDTYGIKNAALPKTKELEINVDSVIEYVLKNKARGLIFSNPCNPTSLCLSKREVMRLVDELPDCLVIVDEAYMDFASDSVIKKAAKKSNLIVLRTASKAVGLAAARIGFAVAGFDITTALKAAKSPYNISAVSQALGAAVYEEELYINECIETIIRSRDHLYGILLAIDARSEIIESIYETSANFVFVKLSNSKEVYEELKKRSIIVRHMNGYLRISAGTKEENIAVCDALREICEKGED